MSGNSRHSHITRLCDELDKCYITIFLPQLFVALPLSLTTSRGEETSEAAEIASFNSGEDK